MKKLKAESFLFSCIIFPLTFTFGQDFSKRATDVVSVDFAKSDYEIVWISPEITIDMLDSKNVEIKIGIKTNAKIEKITIYVNDLPVSNNRGFTKKSKQENYDEVIEHSLILNSGSNLVRLEALTSEGFVIKDEREITVADGAFADIVSRRNFALMFATGDYDQWSDLTNPVNDARDIARELKETYGFEVELIENATQEEVLLKLRQYAEKSYLPKDQLFIFFAGHGHFDETNGEGYIVTKESKTNDLTFSSYLSHNILRNRINNIPSEHIFLTMDACFGGTFDPTIARTGSRGGDNMYEDVGKLELIERKLRYTTRLFLTSGGKVYVPDGRPGMNSPFASKLLEALRSDGGPDGLLTISDIKGYVELVTPEPRLGSFGSDVAGSDFVFERRK